MDPDTGEVFDNCIKADITVTLHKAKLGLIKSNSNIGKLEIVKIGIPPEAEYIAGTGDLRYISRKKRDSESHKGDFGKILVIGGSDQYCGAPAISGLAALRTGSDMVIIAAPKIISNPLRSFSPNLIIRDYSSDFLNPNSIPEIIDLFEWANAIIIGPGLGIKNKTFEAVEQIFEIINLKNIPTLIDADAIKAIANHKNLISGLPVVITPHLGEFNIFTNNEIILPKDIIQRAEVVKNVAKEYNITILLKGAVDIISDGHRFKLNQTGTPAMTVGGTGDCLAGIVGSLLARFNSFRAAVAGAFLCGKAGESAEHNLNGPHILATDLLKYISFKKYL